MSRACGIGYAGLGVVLAMTACYGNETKAFPPGIEPWDATNRAALPAPTATDRYPETLSFVELRYTLPGTSDEINSMHARGYVQTPIAAVWAAARDPQTGRDPTASDGFTVLAWATEPAYQYSFRTHVVVHDIITLEWDVSWRHGLVEGTAEAPLVTATRWQKTNGTDAIPVLEGSLVLRVVDGQPGVTEVQYQYHLDAVTAGYGTIRDYLTSIYGRLRDRAHGRPLMPNDCPGCPAPPAGY